MPKNIKNAEFLATACHAAASAKVEWTRMNTDIETAKFANTGFWILNPAFLCY
jgi:hypothetical protein